MNGRSVDSSVYVMRYGDGFMYCSVEEDGVWSRIDDGRHGGDGMI